MNLYYYFLMDEDYFISIKKEYHYFEKLLSEKVKDSKIFLDTEDCCLIEETWNNELLKCFDEYNKIKKKKKTLNYDNLLPNKSPHFLNDFASILKNLKDNIKLKLVSRKLIELIYEEKYIKEDYFVKFYTGNNKIIIEYKENEDNKELLLIDPLNYIESQDNIFIIFIKDEDKNELFEKILSNKPDCKFESNHFNNYIISFENYLNILKLFIYIYYYEKSLLDNKENILNENEETFYLINPEWINEFKEYYNYSDLCNSLKKIKSNNKKIDYNNLTKYINTIVSKENILNALNFGKNELLDDLIDYEKIKAQTQKKHILYYSNCCVVNSQIMNKIKNIVAYQDIKIYRKNIFVQNNLIYIYYKNKVIIGKLNEKLLFITSYIFSYISKEVFESEKEYLFSCSVEKYINYFNCELNNLEIQILMNKKGKIGELIVLKNEKKLLEKKSRNKSVQNKILNKSYNISNTNNYNKEKRNIYQLDEKNESINDSLNNNSYSSALKKQKTKKKYNYKKDLKDNLTKESESELSKKEGNDLIINNFNIKEDLDNEEVEMNHMNKRINFPSEKVNKEKDNKNNELNNINMEFQKKLKNENYKFYKKKQISNKMKKSENNINENEEYKLEDINKKLKKEREDLNLSNKKNDEEIENECQNSINKKENDIKFLKNELKILKNENKKFKNEINQLQKKIKVKKNK